MGSALTKYVHDIGLLREGNPDNMTYMGKRIYTSKLCEKGKVYFTASSVMVASLDDLILPMLLADVRCEAKSIVRAGLADILEWLGEKK